MSIKACVAVFALVVSGSSAALTWTSCGTGVQCASLSVPLEYASSGTTSASSAATATIPLSRYPATVPQSQRKGSILVNPGGPGASGKNFVINGAGAAISTLSGGYYDIIGWDPRGIGEALPRLTCFDTAGEEYDFVSSLPAAVNTTLGQLKDTTAASITAVSQSVASVDAVWGQLAEACIKKNSSALFTSTAAYIARDMAAIVDQVDGTGAVLNYWGFSYGTILGAEFIQTYPSRVGQIVLDGVVDPAADAKTYDALLSEDQLTVSNAIQDWATFCASAGPSGCAMANGSNKVSDIISRVYALTENLLTNPISVSGIEIGADAVSSFLWSFFLVPRTWPLIAEAVVGLEQRDPSILLEIVSASASPAPANTSAAPNGSSTLWEPILICMDNAVSTGLTLDTVTSDLRNISESENTPWLNADLSPMLFCRNGPTTRPLLANAGASKLSQANKILAAANKSVLIINAEHDTNTPLASAQKVHSALKNSSKLAIRRGPGHTTVSIASLGLAQTVYNFFAKKAAPKVDNQVFPISQLVFDKSLNQTTLTPDAKFNGTYTANETALLQATSDVLLAFLSIA